MGPVLTRIVIQVLKKAGLVMERLTSGRFGMAGGTKVRGPSRLRYLWQALARGMSLCGLLWIIGPGVVSANACGPLANAYGPFDYTNASHRRENLPVVERHHFTDAVFELTSGVSGHIAGDIDYTLRAFPNHHRALDAMSRLGQRERTTQPVGSRYSVDCWFERAKRFAPRDAGVLLVHSIHLHRRGKLADAVAEAQAGLRIDPENPELHYNLGLYLVDKGDFANALEHARAAYAQGYPLPGLRRRLERAGHWAE
jgi:tetratricopeptide (TPR) repeat protein